MQRISLNRSWRFQSGDSLAMRWSAPEISTWQEVNLPHDWSIEQDRSPQNPSVASGGFFTMGFGWYYKTFTVLPEWQNKKVVIEFEGVYMNAEVWLNNHYLGRHAYGYTTFHFDLTPFIQFDGENVLRVSVDNSLQLNSRWYSGSGIYRPAWLLVMDIVHVKPWGVYVTTPRVSSETASVLAVTTVENEAAQDQTVILRTTVTSLAGKSLAVSETTALIAPGASHNFSQEMVISKPDLWSPDNPTLYRLHSEVLAGTNIVDAQETSFGIRSLHFSAEQGFLLNGQPMLMKGGCVHHDNGILGAASFARSEERKVEIHKANGYNAIRCAHNPPSPAFLDACDRLGILVIDEAFDCWREGKTPGDYHCVFDDCWQTDLDSMLLRDRNHPCIVVWSIGNELVERMQPEGAALAHRLADHVRSVDPTRPVTAAINGSHTLPWSDTAGIHSALDVNGYNYRQNEYAADLEQFPQRIIFGTESTALQAFEHWMDVVKYPNVIGDFVWTSLDYLGESGIGRVYYEAEPFEFLGKYPWHQANCGDFDLCGFKRPQSYYRDILWERGDKLYIAVHDPVPQGKTRLPTFWGWPEVWPNWTWQGKEGQVFKIDVYSACELVELFLNGRTLGVQPTTPHERFTASFEVPYESGELMAVGYTSGKPEAEFVLKSMGKPAAIRLSPDRPNLNAGGDDLCYVTVEVIDAEGRLHPTASNKIFFTVQGVGTIAALGNSNPVSAECYVGNQRRAHRGRCLVVVKTQDKPGTIILRAQADGLESAEVKLLAA